MGGERSELCYAGGMKRIPERLTSYARELRNSSTKAERLLWVRLRHSRPRFTRQLVIEPFIVDLACREAKLAIELDGSQHAEALEVTKRLAKDVDALRFQRVQTIERHAARMPTPASSDEQIFWARPSGKSMRDRAGAAAFAAAEPTRGR